MTKPVSLAAVRRLAVAAQGYAARFRRADSDAIVECVRRLSCVQLDSISVVERSHLLVLGARVGRCEPGAVSTLLAQGKLFEYWAHEACLLDIDDYPLWRRRMREREHHHWWGPVIASNRPLANRILGDIRERGPLASRHFEGKGGGGMWNLKPAKKMLDALWTAGQLVVSGRQGFQRIYDLPERVLPVSALEASIPSAAEALRQLILKAVRARGALTASGIVNHYKFKGGVTPLRTPLNQLVRTGELKQFDVEDGGAPVFASGDVELSATDNGANSVLLSPFENLLWDRAFVRRFFNFDHLIEVYKRQEHRQYGYYVLPFLWNDKLVGRADLKAHRDQDVLRVKAFHLEPGVRDTSALQEALHKALARLAKTLDLTVANKGVDGGKQESR